MKARRISGAATRCRARCAPGLFATFVIAVLASLPGPLGHAASLEERQRREAPLAFVGVDVLTMEHPDLLRDQTVLIEGTRIVAVGARNATDVPHGARVIGGGRRVLMPGLVDAHIHLRDADSTALLEYLRAGITCAREMNGRPFVVAWRDRIEAGELSGPRLRVAGPTLGNWSSPKEGYPTPETKAEGAEVVRRFLQAGYDWIKVYSFLPREGFGGVMEESTRLGIPVGGHVPVAAGLGATMTSGIRSIEHLTEYVGSALTPEDRELDETDFRSLFGAGEVDWARMDSLISATVASGVWNVPTLVWFDRHLPASMAQEAWSDPVLRAQGARNRREIVRRLHVAGALLAVGTDSDAGDQLGPRALHDELGAIVDAGIDAEDALRLATVGGSTLLQLHDDQGTVTPGKRADLLLLPCDPREDMTCLSRLELVVANGQVVER